MSSYGMWWSAAFSQGGADRPCLHNTRMTQADISLEKDFLLEADIYGEQIFSRSQLSCKLPLYIYMVAAQSLWAR